MKARYLLRAGVGAWILFLAVGSISGCSHRSVAPPAAPAAKTEITPNQSAARTPAKIDVYVLAAKSRPGAGNGDANGLVARPMPAIGQLSDPATAAIQALASSPNSPLPPGTKLLGLTVDPAGTATVNFSQQFQSNFQGGETREAQSVDSVLQTLGQFPDIRNVQFLVAGKKIDSLGGTLELDAPLPTQHPGVEIASSSPA